MNSCLSGHGRSTRSSGLISASSSKGRIGFTRNPSQPASTAASGTGDRALAVAAMMGIANAINQPARLALIPDLVDRANLPSAVAINSIVFNGARFIGPMIAGIVIAHGGISLAFALTAAS